MKQRRTPPEQQKVQVALWVRGQEGVQADAHVEGAPGRAELALPHLPESQAAMLSTWITDVPHLPPPELEAALSAAAWKDQANSKIVMLTSGARGSVPLSWLTSCPAETSVLLQTSRGLVRPRSHSGKCRV